MSEYNSKLFNIHNKNNSYDINVIRYLIFYLNQ